MNNLCRLSHVKADLAGVDGTTVLDATLVRLIDQVSDEFVRECGRPLHSEIATRYIDVPADAGDQLWLDQDLLSITTLKFDDDGDYTYGLTLAVNTDYWLWPSNKAPYRRIDLNPRSPNLTTWSQGRRRVQIVGLWGYSNETEDTGLTGTLSDAADTSLTANATAAALIFPGDTLLIESEQVYVSAVATTTITVVRGVNGTTAVAHASKPLLVRRYPRHVEMVIAERVVGLRWDSQGGYSEAATLIGDASGAAGSTTLRASYARWRKAVKTIGELPGVG